MEQVSLVLNAIGEMQEDNTVPKNIRAKLTEIATTLQDGSDVSITINKALGDLGEISDDVNLQPYTRTQLWNLVSLLETI